MKSPLVVLALAASMSVAAEAGAQVTVAQWNQPTIDRWMYPFNSSPTTRPVASTFGSDREDPTQFDSRDGQIILSFETSDQLPPAGGPYEILEAEVTLAFANDLVATYDPTSDPWQMFLPASDPRRVADPDAGQPVELAGVGFRGGFTAATFKQDSAFAAPGASFLSPGVRNAYAACFDQAGQLVDISNHPRVGFQPSVFAVGAIDGLAAGQPVPVNSVMKFAVSVTDANIQSYLRQGLDAGRIFFSVSSLTFVAQQSGNYPTFYAKANILVQLGLAQAAHLRLKVQPASVCRLGDLDCSGTVDAADLGLLLLYYGPCEDGCSGADLDGSGEVDSADLGLLLLNFD
jgi:hypothetical protein